MLQIYLLTELYFIFSAAFILSDTYGTYFLFLINLRNFIYGNKIAKNVTWILGILLIIGNALLPMSPGPMLLGDFLPILNIVALMFFFIRRFPKDAGYIDIYKKYDTLGFVTLGVAFIHFIFPGFVIL